jgi:6-phosphogluconolactonase
MPQFPPDPSPCLVEICDDEDHFVAEATGAVIAALSQAIDARGQAIMAVPGGTTPGPIFDRLSQSKLDWAKVTVTLVDERLVDPASPDSNERLVRERLLQGPGSAAQFIPLTVAGPQTLALPFDLVVLGMGEDGHIASMFPGNPALAEALTGDGICVEIPAGDGRAPPQPRRTLTLKAVNAARRRLLLFTGQAKLDVYRAALQSRDPYLYPVAGVLNAPDDLQILICV